MAQARERLVILGLRLLFLLVLALALISGCGDNLSTTHLPAVDNYDFYLSSDLDSNARTAYFEAVRQWTMYTDVQITTHEGYELCGIGCFDVFLLPRWEIDDLTDSTYIGVTVPGAITVATDMDYDETQDTFIHEMGHALGLMHPCTSPCSDYAVMNPSYRGGADHVACADVDQFYSERGLEVNRFCNDSPGALDETLDGGPVE